MHTEKHFKSSDLVTDIVIGMSDGLTVPFALAAGLAGAGSFVTPAIIITAGIAEIAAGSIAMGLGGYLAGKTEVDHYESELKREYYEVEFLPDKEKEEVREILEHMGLDAASQKTIVEALAKDKDKWVDFMMRFELGLEKPDAGRASKSALNIGLSYIAGGLVPLSPYFFAPNPATGLVWSCVITICCLFVFGYVKAKVTGQQPWFGALKVVFIGGIAAAAAYLIAGLFRH